MLKIFTRKSDGRKMCLFSWVVFAFLVLLMATFFAVYIWGLYTGFKSISEFNIEQNIVWFPHSPTFDNFITVIQNFYVEVNGKMVFFEGMFLNSVLYACVSALIQSFVQCFMAYLVAKFRYKFSSVLYWVVIVAMTIPIVGSDISMIQILQGLNLYDTMVSMYIMKFSFLGPYFLVFYSTFRMLPDDYAEAAYIDGASELRVFVYIMIPMVANMFFTIFLLNMIAYWNDYRAPLLYIPSSPTLSYGIQYLSTTTLTEFSQTPVRLAACVIAIIPILIIFFLFRGKIMSKVAIGGVKE